MTAEEALKLLDINPLEIIHSKEYEDNTSLVVGTYKNETISVIDNKGTFIIDIGYKEKIFEVAKETGTIKEINIVVA